MTSASVPDTTATGAAGGDTGGLPPAPAGLLPGMTT